MIIKESSLHNTKNILERLISINEYKLPIDSVFVFSNERLNKYLIQLESFINYSREHNLTDGGYVISRICKENNIEDYIENIGFVINEESLFDKENLDSYKQIKEAMFPVYVSRISKDDIYYTKLLNSMAMDGIQENFDSCLNLKNYCNNPINHRFGNENLRESNSSLIKKICCINKLNNKLINENKFIKGEQNVMNTKKSNVLKKATECIRSKIC